MSIYKFIQVQLQNYPYTTQLNYRDLITPGAYFSIPYGIEK